MTNFCQTLIGKFKQTLNKTNQFSLILLALLVSPQMLAQNATPPENTGFDLIIDKLICRGNENTQCDFITKKYYQSVGDYVDPDEIADARLRLGTLQQFKNVSISLEKSKQRGHVNVIFEVDEAPHVQYSLGSHYRGYDSRWAQSDGFGQSVGVTDFNFLGTGKELSFNVTGGYSESGYSGRKSYSKGYSANLSYYDPHLNDSVDYFLSASLSYDSSKTSYTDAIFTANQGLENLFKGSSSNSRSDYSLAVGRRFASHSFISFGARHSYYSFGDRELSTDENSRVFMAYGWDSTDDKLFATQGSAFRAELNTTLDGDSASLYLSYQDNIRLSEDYVFGYQVSEHSTLKSPYDHTERLDPQLSLTLSDIDSSEKASGKYTGWRYSMSTPLRDIDTNTLSFGLSYIYQTDQLIMNFSLNYHPDFGG
jgi:hypothetical protein